jgi:hypothetical protein
MYIALTSFDGDIDGLFEGDWLGVVVGCDNMNMSKSDKHGRISSSATVSFQKKYTRYVHNTYLF